MKPGMTLLAGVVAALCMNTYVAAKEVTLRFSWWGGAERHENTLKAVKMFEEKNPGVKIKAEYMGFLGYQERLTTQIAGGTEPDIMQINWAWLPTFSKNGDGFYDLNKLKGTLKFDEFDAEEIKSGTVKGKVNALPGGYTGRVFLWNKTTFDKAGFPLPTSWDELFATGKVFQQKLGDKAYPIDGEAYDMILLSHAYVTQKFGTQYIHPTEPKVAMSKEALREWVKVYKRFSNEKVAVPLPIRASLGGAEKPTDQQADWVDGNWAGNYAWDSTLRLRQSVAPKETKFDVGSFLVLPNAKASGMFARPTFMYTISKRAKEPEMAAKFLNYLMTDPDVVRVMGLSRGIPSAQTQFDVLVKENRIPPVELKAFLQIKRFKSAGHIVEPSPLLEHARMHSFLREIFEKLSYDKITEEEAVNRLLTEGNDLLQRIK